MCGFQGPLAPGGECRGLTVWNRCAWGLYMYEANRVRGDPNDLAMTAAICAADYDVPGFVVKNADVQCAYVGCDEPWYVAAQSAAARACPRGTGSGPAR